MKQIRGRFVFTIGKISWIGETRDRALLRAHRDGFIPAPWKDGPRPLGAA